MFNLHNINKNTLKNCFTEEQDNEEYVLKFIQKYESSFKYVSKRLKSDDKFVHEALNVNPGVFKHLPQKYKSDIEICSVVFKVNGMLLKRADYSIKNNKNLVMIAVKKNSYAINFASKELQDDFDIIIATFDKTYQYGRKYKNNYEFVLKAIDLHPNYYQILDYNMKMNKKIAILAIKNDPYLYNICPWSLRNDHEIISVVLKANQKSFYYVSQKNQKNRRFNIYAKECCIKKYIDFKFVPKVDKYHEILNRF